MPSTPSTSQRPVWRLRDRLFSSTQRLSSSSSSGPQSNATSNRPTTADHTNLPDHRFEPPPSQFASWSDAMYRQSAPHRSDTFNSVSSGSWNDNTARPSMKKVKSQDSIRSSQSAPASERIGRNSSTVPIPKPIKLKLKGKTKYGKTSDLNRVFLAQELDLLASSSDSAELHGPIEPISPRLPSSPTLAARTRPSRRQRLSWAPSSSEPAAPARDLTRRPSDLAIDQPPQLSTSASASSDSDGQSSPVEDSASEQVRVDRQLGAGSRVNTVSTLATSVGEVELMDPPKSPAKSFLSLPDATDATLGNSAKVKRAKSVQRHKTWALAFSLDGKYLAAAGTDRVIRIYETLGSVSLRDEEVDNALYRAEHDQTDGCIRNCGRRQSSVCSSLGCPASKASTGSGSQAAAAELAPVFRSVPVRCFKGHMGDIMDLRWSKNGFLLSCGSDKTAKLWHPQRGDCLCTFTTPDVVSSVDFHPNDDRYFISGGLDGKLRLWNIAARKLQSVIDVPGVITAVSFSASGAWVCVGTHSGALLTFACSHALTYINTVSVKSKSASKSAPGSKITGISPMKIDGGNVTDDLKNTLTDAEFMMITSNDSRIRFYSLASRRLVSRFKSPSYTNRSSQVRAASSSDSQYIISGSEDSSIHVWSLGSNVSSSLLALKRSKPSKASKTMPDIGDDSACRSWTAGSGIVRCAVFAPQATQDILDLAKDPLGPYVQPGAPVAAPSRIVVSIDDSNVLRVWRTDPQARLLA
ncbi:WD40 repeat-like protein [Testicularia cyperi]|uniref:WD40 repeat-like protein n=1 Tax=Testicularia cyperi TaxID=1882483 RepID=A0A317XLN4_9BASI|nr:WD40 repeat-like protein [Testicularia cyperi]